MGTPLVFQSNAGDYLDAEDEGSPGSKKWERVAINKIARIHTLECIARLMDWVRQSDNPELSVKAAGMILDRGWGRPTESVALEADVTVRGIDRPPVETREEWLARKAREFANEN